MKTVVLLAMHGAPPRDFPKEKLVEFFDLHFRLEAMAGTGRAPMEKRLQELERELREWPRTAENDPFHAASMELARLLAQESGSEVLVGFNEFCRPDLDEAFAKAVAGGAEHITVVTPMMTPGGEHAEEDHPGGHQAGQGAVARRAHRVPLAVRPGGGRRIPGRPDRARRAGAMSRARRPVAGASRGR
jgi:sirohydrochlorin cobaltochelatase